MRFISVSAVICTIPENTKHLYNVGPAAKTLGRRCINIIQMFRVCWDDTYIGSSSYRTLYSGFHYEMYIGSSSYHTMYSGFHYETLHRYQPSYITLCTVVFTMRRTSASVYITLCRPTVVFTVRRVLVSSHIAPCIVAFTMRSKPVSAQAFHCETYAYIGMTSYRTVCSGSLSETYISISPCHTMCSGIPN